MKATAPLKTFWRFEKLAVHIEWLADGCEHTPPIGTLRVFEDPIGTIDVETGQPWKAFCWSCNVLIAPPHMVWTNAQTGPLFSYMKAFKAIARKLACTHGTWERWHEGQKMTMAFRA